MLWPYTFIQYSKMEWNTINQNNERTMLKYLVMSMPGTNSMNSQVFENGYKFFVNGYKFFVSPCFVIFVDYTEYTKNAL